VSVLIGIGGGGRSKRIGVLSVDGVILPFHWTDLPVLSTQIATLSMVTLWAFTLRRRLGMAMVLAVAIGIDIAIDVMPRSIG